MSFLLTKLTNIKRLLKGYWVFGGDESDLIHKFNNGTLEETEIRLDRRPGNIPQ